MNSAKTEVAQEIKTQTHLEDIGETYFEHMGHAWSFSWCMLKTSFKTFLHGIFPETFKTAGSDCIRRLHDCMVVNRKNLSK